MLPIASGQPRALGTDGRPPKLTGEQIVLAQKLIGKGTAAREVDRMLNVHPATLYVGTAPGREVISDDAHA